MTDLSAIPPYLMPPSENYETYLQQGMDTVRSFIGEMFITDTSMDFFRHRRYGVTAWGRPSPCIITDHRSFKSLDIGEVRTLYYQELALTMLHNEGELDFLPLGSSFFEASGILQDKNEWLVHDRYLMEGLSALGLSWARVEACIFEAFWQALPKSFQALQLNHASGYDIISWKYAIEDWGWYFSRRKSIAKKADALFSLIDGTPFSSQLWFLRQVVRQLDWAEAPNLNLKNYCTQRKSPLVAAVVNATANIVWNDINCEAQPPSLAYARTLVTKKAFADEGDEYYQAPAELWQLVADIIYHLSIIKGLPGTSPLDYKDQTADKQEALTADSIRQRVAVR